MGKTLARSYDFALLAGTLRASPGRDRLVPRIRMAETGSSQIRTFETNKQICEARMTKTGAAAPLDSHICTFETNGSANMHERVIWANLRRIANESAATRPTAKVGRRPHVGTSPFLVD